MATLIEGAGVPLACEARGAGAPALVIHGIASDARDVAPLATALAERGARAIAYDRRGYGASGMPEPYEATTVHEQAEDAARVLGALAEAPALAVGLGFGALVALDLLVRHRGALRAAVLSDPPLLAFVPEAAQALAEQRLALEAALRDGGPAEAVGRWLGDDADRVRAARAGAAHRAFFADLAGLASWPTSRATLRAIDAPAVVLSGPATEAHVVRAADALAALLPSARRATDGDVLGAALSVAGR